MGIDLRELADWVRRTEILRRSGDRGYVSGRDIHWVGYVRVVFWRPKGQGRLPTELRYSRFPIQ